MPRSCRNPKELCALSGNNEKLVIIEPDPKKPRLVPIGNRDRWRASIDTDFLKLPLRLFGNPGDERDPFSVGRYLEAFAAVCSCNGLELVLSQMTRVDAGARFF